MKVNTYFPKSFLMPVAFFLPVSGVVGSVCVLSLVEECCGSPARSRCSVPARSTSAVRENHRVSTRDRTRPAPGCQPPRTEAAWTATCVINSVFLPLQLEGTGGFKVVE